MTAVKQNKFINDFLEDIPNAARNKMLRPLAIRYGSENVKEYRRRLSRTMITQLEIGEILMAAKNAGFTPEGVAEAKRIAQEQLARLV